MKTDSEFYELARDLPLACVLLVAGARPHGAYAAGSPTLKRAERRMDQVLEPADDRDPWWVVEFQGYRDQGAERRLVLGAVFLAEERDLWGRVRMGIVFTTRAIAEACRPATIGPGGSDLGRDVVRVVLGELEPDELLARGPELFPLLPLTAIGLDELERRLPAWRRTLRSTGLDRGALGALTDNFLRFFAARHKKSRLERVRRILEVLMPIEDTQLGKDLIALGVRRGRKEGRKEGREEGRQEGEKLALVATVRDVLAVRFGSVPRDFDRLIAGLAVEELGQVHRQALEAKDLRDFRRRVRAVGA